MTKTPTYLKDVDMAHWVRKTELVERGWTEGSIRKFLGQPDATVRNFFGTLSVTGIWRRERVEEIEARPDIAALLAKRLKKRKVEELRRAIDKSITEQDKQADLANLLHDYMSFRAHREGVGYALDPSFFLANLLMGVDKFFGIEVDDDRLKSDTQNPEAFRIWQHSRSLN